jgi:hypothetical protein
VSVTVKVPMTELAPGTTPATETVVVEPARTGPLVVVPIGTRVSSSRTGVWSISTLVWVPTQALMTPDDCAVTFAMVWAVS